MYPGVWVAKEEALPLSQEGFWALPGEGVTGSAAVLTPGRSEERTG